MSITIYNSEQIKKIEKACLITANILDELEAQIVEGISTFDIDLLARDLIEKNKVKPLFLGYGGFPAVICTSVNYEVIHGIPDKKKKLNNGDIIGIDFGVSCDGWCGDSARTVPVGTISDDVRLLLDVTKSSLYEGIASANTSSRFSDISSAVEKYVQNFGFSPVREFSGHGIGANLHEEPSIPNYGKSGKGPRIKNGMVFAIEPMINIGRHEIEILDDDWTVITKDRSYSAHFEHTVAIVNDMPKILTRGSVFN